jgi:hypothetical protein
MELKTPEYRLVVNMEKEFNNGDKVLFHDGSYWMVERQLDPYTIKISYNNNSGYYNISTRWTENATIVPGPLSVVKAILKKYDTK